MQNSMATTAKTTLAAKGCSPLRTVAPGGRVSASQPAPSKATTGSSR
jgi:hypothetical protein